MFYCTMRKPNLLSTLCTWVTSVTAILPLDIRYVHSQYGVNSGAVDEALCHKMGGFRFNCIGVLGNFQLTVESTYRGISFRV